MSKKEEVHPARKVDFTQDDAGRRSLEQDLGERGRTGRKTRRVESWLQVLTGEEQGRE